MIDRLSQADVSPPPAAAGTAAASVPAGDAGPSLVDVHQHVIPPSWRALAERGTGAVGWRLPDWDPESARAFRQARGIGAAVLSNNISSILVGRPDQADLVRASNDYTAALVAESPRELGFFASLPLPGLEGSLTELSRSFDELGADGVVLPTSVAGVYLGDPGFEPLWAELGRRGAVVFLHPDEPTFPAIPGIPAVLVDFVLETMRCAVNLVARGVVHRHPGARIILSHGGGGLASVAHRVAYGLPLVDPSRSGDEWLADFRSFYVEAALAGTDPALAALTAFLPDGHLLFGTDHPYAPEPAVDRFRSLLDDSALDDDRRASLNYGAARALFPRLAAPAPQP